MEFGVQQLQLGKILNKESKARTALKVMKEAGFNSIELNGFMIRKSPFIVRLLTSAYGMPIKKSFRFDWKKMLKDYDLHVISIHEDLDTLETNLDMVIQECKDFDCHYVVVTGMYNYDYSSFKAVKELATRLNEVGRRLKPHNLFLLYHNHNVEFVHVNKSRLAYDILISNTDPLVVNFEFDSYWPSVAGVDALFYMKRLGKRIRLHHICDNGNLNQKKFLTPIIKTNAVELGLGSLNLEAFLKQDLENETEAVILEQHKNYIHDDPIESLFTSAEYLQNFKKACIK
ncbi:MAG: sugar phosphate isomerase/epimerase [Bacilli bacterium]|nr:sugar phosphate isomerase/epimerase [Bacilli bacterium]